MCTIVVGITNDTLFIKQLIEQQSVLVLQPLEIISYYYINGTAMKQYIISMLHLTYMYLYCVALPMLYMYFSHHMTHHYSTVGLLVAIIRLY